MRCCDDCLVDDAAVLVVLFSVYRSDAGWRIVG